MISSQENMCSKRKSKSVSSFIMKTYELLMDEQNWKIVRWSHNGIGFVVLNQDQFAKLILPKYFKHSNYSSFVRQLNMYNFHKIRQHNGESYFHHECFDRDNSSSLVEIKRKPQKKKRKSIQDDESVDSQLHSNFHQKLSDKENPQPHADTPSSFSKEESSKMIQQEQKDCVIPKSKLISQPNDKFFNSTRQLFSSQFTIKFQNIPFEQTSSKKINQNYFESRQDNQDKISINDQIEQRDEIGLLTFPTKEFMYPSKNNILPLGNIKDSASFDMFY